MNDPLSEQTLSAISIISKSVIETITTEVIDKIDEMHRSDKKFRYDVFLSHSHKNNAYTDLLDTALEDYHLKVFYDRKSIKWGDNFDQVIVDALNNSRCAIFVVSKAFIESEPASNELEDYYSQSKKNSNRNVFIIKYGAIRQEDINEKFPFAKYIQLKNSGKKHIEDTVREFVSIFVSRFVDGGQQ